jgi:hypothetical protein
MNEQQAGVLLSLLPLAAVAAAQHACWEDLETGGASGAAAGFVL